MNFINLLIVMVSIFFTTATVALIFFIGSMIKKSKVSHSVTVSRMTQDGETVAIHSNFLDGQGYVEKRGKLFELAQLGDDRLKFCDDRFKALLAAEKAKQSGLSKVD